MSFEVTTSYEESAEPGGGSNQSLFQQTTEVGIKPSWMTLQEANEKGYEEPKTARYRNSGFILNLSGDYRLHRGDDDEQDIVQEMTNTLAKALTPYMGGDPRAMSIFLKLSVDAAKA